MKKTFLIFSLVSLLSSFGIVVFAYTGADENRANFLATEHIIMDHSDAPVQYRFDDKIIRQEMVSIALKIKWISIPSGYTCKKYFSDVTGNDWVCWAVEAAADNGIISRWNTKFRPKDFVTRAEALAMLSSVVCLPKLTAKEYSFLEEAFPELVDQHENKSTWQKALWETLSWGTKDIGLSGMDATNTMTEAQKTQSNAPNTDITRAEVFSFGEYFLSYQKKYGACETTVRQPIIFSTDDVTSVPNKTTGKSTSTGTYTVQYPDALVSGEVRYIGVMNVGVRTSKPFNWDFITSTKETLLTQKKLQFFSIGSTRFAAIYSYESANFYRVKVFEYGNFWVKDVFFYDSAKKIDLSEDALAAGSDNPSLGEYTSKSIRLEWSTLFLESYDSTLGKSRLKKYQYSDGVFVRVGDVVI